jgi:hypothetical protein
MIQIRALRCRLMVLGDREALGTDQLPSALPLTEKKYAR